MQYLTIKETKIPALGFGTFKLNGALCTKMVRYALEVGYRHIDTAQAYDNETAVGKALQQSAVDREALFLTTKVWLSQLAYADVKRSTEASLRHLKTDYVDLLLIHWPNDSVPLHETLKALNELKEAGKTRHIGVSNFTVSLLREATERHGVALLCNQVEYHPFLSQQSVLDYLRTHGMMLTAYTPLARGETARHPTLQAIAHKYSKTATQVGLRWLIQQQNVAAIPKAAAQGHCLSNAQIFDFSLTQLDMDAINKLNKNRRLISPKWAPSWDTN